MFNVIDISDQHEKFLRRAPYILTHFSATEIELSLQHVPLDSCDVAPLALAVQKNRKRDATLAEVLGKKLRGDLELNKVLCTALEDCPLTVLALEATILNGWVYPLSVTPILVQQVVGSEWITSRLTIVGLAVTATVQTFCDHHAIKSLFSGGNSLPLAAQLRDHFGNAETCYAVINSCRALLSTINASQSGERLADEITMIGNIAQGNIAMTRRPHDTEAQMQHIERVLRLAESAGAAPEVIGELRSVARVYLSLPERDTCLAA